MNRKLPTRLAAIRRDPWENDTLSDDASCSTSWVKQYEGGTKRRQYLSATTG